MKSRANPNQTRDENMSDELEITVKKVGKGFP